MTNVLGEPDFPSSAGSQAPDAVSVCVSSNREILLFVVQAGNSLLRHPRLTPLWEWTETGTRPCGPHVWIFLFLQAFFALFCFFCRGWWGCLVSALSPVASKRAQEIQVYLWFLIVQGEMVLSCTKRPFSSSILIFDTPSLSCCMFLLIDSE